METLKTLEALAAGGDAAAQYRLAAHYARLGRHDEARRLTGQAAASGHAGALYTRASELLSAPPAQMRLDEAVGMLKRAADAGGGAARRQLAVLHAFGLGVERDWRKAVALVAQAAQGGYPPAMRELACLAAMGGGYAKGVAPLLRAAALKGDWIALYLALRRGGVIGAAEGAGAAARLRAAGAPLADRLRDPAGDGVSVAPDMQRLTAAAGRAAAPLSDAKKAALNKTPDIAHVKNALSTDECDYVICAAAGLLQRSRVVDSEIAAASHAQYRTSDEATFGVIDLDLTLFAIYARLAALAGAPVENCELMGVLRYRPGQEYKPHHDYLPEDAADYSEVQRSGQRVGTVLVPLNDGFEGGETLFPRLDIEFAGAPGDALDFHNTDENEKPYPQTLHAGAPVSAGEKWLLTIWRRARPFWFWI